MAMLGNTKMEPAMAEMGLSHVNIIIPRYMLRMVASMLDAYALDQASNPHPIDLIELGATFEQASEFRDHCGVDDVVLPEHIAALHVAQLLRQLSDV